MLRKGTNPEVILDFIPFLEKENICLIMTFTQVDSYSAFFDNTGEEGAGSTGLAEMIEGTTEVLVVDVELASCYWHCCCCHRHW